MTFVVLEHIPRNPAMMTNAFLMMPHVLLLFVVAVVPIMSTAQMMTTTTTLAPPEHNVETSGKHDDVADAKVWNYEKPQLECDITDNTDNWGTGGAAAHYGETSAETNYGDDALAEEMSNNDAMGTEGTLDTTFDDVVDGVDGVEDNSSAAIASVPTTTKSPSATNVANSTESEGNAATAVPENGHGDGIGTTPVPNSGDGDEEIVGGERPGEYHEKLQNEDPSATEDDTATSIDTEEYGETESVNGQDGVTQAYEVVHHQDGAQVISGEDPIEKVESTDSFGSEETKGSKLNTAAPDSPRRGIMNVLTNTDIVGPIGLVFMLLAIAYFTRIVHVRSISTANGKQRMVDDSEMESLSDDESYGDCTEVVELESIITSSPSPLRKRATGKNGFFMFDDESLGSFSNNKFETPEATARSISFEHY